MMLSLMFFVYSLFGLHLIPNYIECAPSEASSSKTAAYDWQWLQSINRIPMGKSHKLSHQQMYLLSENPADSAGGLEMYTQKMRELKCIYGRIFQGMFDYTNRVLTRNVNVTEAWPALEEFKKKIAKMFSALLAANDHAYPWMWRVYFMVYAVERPTLTEFVSSYKTDTVLKGNIDTFVDSCTAQHYLHPSSNTNAEQYVIDSLTVQGQNQPDYAYQNANLFGMDELLLKAFRTDSMFERSRVNDFQDKLKKRLFAVWDAPRSDFYSKQINLVIHHNLIATLIHCSISHYVWMYLDTVKKDQSVNTQTALDALMSPLNLAVKLLDNHSDEFYNDLLSKIQSRTVSAGTLPGLLAKAKENFGSHFSSLSVHGASRNNIELIEMLTKKKSNSDKNAASIFASDLKNYIKKLGSFSFELIDFYKSSTVGNN